MSCDPEQITIAAEMTAERTRYRDAWFARRRTLDPSRVLVVDADFSRGAVTASMVRAAGWFVTRRACSARSALSIALKFLPGVVLLSTDLPDLTAYSLAAALREDATLCCARLIALAPTMLFAGGAPAFRNEFEQYMELPLEQTALVRVLLDPARQAYARATHRVRRH